MTWLETLFGPAGAYAVQVLKIIGIDIVLAGDNAVVIALACRTLPANKRTLGILLGAGTAVVLRIIFTLVVQQLLDISLLKLLGGLLLIWIAVKLVTAEEPDEHSIKSGTSLWEAVRIIAIADMVMSLDNVLAIAAAAHGDAFLIIMGLIVSIPLVVGGATIITQLLVRYPILIWAGAALLGWVAGELIATEPMLHAHVASLADTLGLTAKHLARAFEVIGALLVIAIGYSMRRLADAGKSA
ncbi:MAG: YjbE family putative metal transport protein [Hyphomicrobium zavarzinii]|jgi:YjbE family integral membrane protein|uniref:YjbE family putative metal transport protein n=1 Tax=Hyphomicrobium TaxID=81 RepID=UPI001A5FE9E6|nr:MULTISPECIES: YjbE family putative metal transport protein [Hyphomicrobium]MBL8846307.1 YjbE family putative metal transport protein [Hyphomicrobium zavarzinii]WBT38357.1 YjbE family putative metal transport protein [Hyphomicrobium sp. DMF-1]HML41736.1 YjbE family putative metal transport protein [Hyphomicrobium zavarzinii]